MPDINISYQWGINTCNAPNIGYSQTYRNQRTVNGITYYDCSSFIWYALMAGGWDVVGAHDGDTWPVVTSEEIGWLQRLGWTEVSRSEISNADVCWRPGHTEMVYDATTGQTMGAHSSSYPLDRQVSITSGDTASNFTRFFTAGGATGGYGYSLYVISALCGNAWRESNINPALHQIGGGAYGIFQWDGDRRTALENWLTTNGYSLTDGNAQCQYLIVEDDWIQNYGSYATLQEFLTSTSTDIDDLVICFCRNWERAGVEAMEERIAHAHECFNYIQTHAQDTSITQWITRDGYLTESEILNNAVMLYRFYSTGGGGGTDTDTHEHLPIWMYTKKKGVIVQWR